MKHLHTSAIRKASELRLKLGMNLFQPVNIYDICTLVNIDVQFVDVNMEGLYINNHGSSKILISSLRPFPRRVFTCGHELGHHLFGHGLKIDTISDDYTTLKNDDEKLVDSFSAALLMPIGGIQAEFNKRDLKLEVARPEDYYTISSLFGIGYRTLITHCKINGLIAEGKSTELLRSSPAKIFAAQFGENIPKSFFKIIDGKSELKPIDLEVSNYLILPEDFVINNAFLEKKMETKLGCLFVTKKAGIFSVHSTKSDLSFFIRIQPQNYNGFAEYRHLEN